MNLSKREISTLGGGAVALAALFAYRIFFASAGDGGLASADTIEGALRRIEEHKAAERSIARLSDELKLKIPSAPAADQEKEIREDLDRRAQRAGLMLASVRRADAPSRAKTSEEKPVQFRLELYGRFDALVGFLDSLERAERPYIARELQVEASSRQPVPAPPPGEEYAEPTPTPPPMERGSEPRGNVKATMKVQSYLFSAVEPPPPPKATPAPAKPEDPKQTKPEAAATTHSAPAKAEKTPEPGVATDKGIPRPPAGGANHDG